MHILLKLVCGAFLCCFFDLLYHKLFDMTNLSHASVYNANQKKEISKAKGGREYVYKAIKENDYSGYP